MNVDTLLIPSAHWELKPPVGKVSKVPAGGTWPPGCGQYSAVTLCALLPLFSSLHSGPALIFASVCSAFDLYNNKIVVSNC